MEFKLTVDPDEFTRLVEAQHALMAVLDYRKEADRAQDAEEDLTTSEGPVDVARFRELCRKFEQNRGLPDVSRALAFDSLLDDLARLVG